MATFFAAVDLTAVFLAAALGWARLLTAGDDITFSAAIVGVAVHCHLLSAKAHACPSGADS
jgi:hypothetical protein